MIISNRFEINKKFKQVFVLKLITIYSYIYNIWYYN